MNMNRRHFSSALLGLAGVGLLAGPTVQAQPNAFVQGREYTRVDPPQPVADPGKIEVIEFFSYACPHCSAYEPILGPWLKQLPADVVVRRVPVTFMMNAENFQRTYYALEAMGIVDQMQLKIFRAIHIDHLRLEKPEDFAEFVGKNGGDAAKFLATFKSFSVATALNRGKKAMADYKIDSVPVLVINGRYITSPQLAGGAVQSLAVADFLIQQSRKK
ncbi:MAG: thiol:disulfide interchange protein DsbA/DsbL [Caldimonas sp.]